MPGDGTANQRREERQKGDRDQEIQRMGFLKLVAESGRKQRKGA